MRTVEEWIGKTPDAMPPASVYRRLWNKQHGRCPKCTRELTAGNVTREHLKPIAMGGENRESNLELWCSVPCSSDKTAQEAAPRAKSDRVLDKTMGFKSPSKAKARPMPGNRNSRWKKTVNHGWVRR